MFVFLINHLIISSYIPIPSDPGSPSENGFMESKYLLRFGGDSTHPKIMGLQDWLIGPYDRGKWRYN